MLWNVANFFNFCINIQHFHRFVCVSTCRYQKQTFLQKLERFLAGSWFVLGHISVTWTQQSCNGSGSVKGKYYQRYHHTGSLTTIDGLLQTDHSGLSPHTLSRFKHATGWSREFYWSTSFEALVRPTTRTNYGNLNDEAQYNSDLCHFGK